MADTTGQNSNLGPFFLSGGLGLTGAGWSTVLTYPNVVNTWTFWQSPSSQYWGPSNNLRATLESMGANILELPVAPPGSVTQAEGAMIGLRPGQVNPFNGALGESEMNALLGAGGLNYGGQNFYVAGKLFTQVDGVTAQFDAVTGWTISNNSSKMGYSSAVSEALIDQRFFAIPVELAQRLGIPGVLSYEGTTVLATSGAVSGIAEARFLGQLSGLAGLGLGAVSAVAVPLDLYNGYQAYQAGGPEWGLWLGTSGLSYGGAIAGAGYAAWTAGGFSWAAAPGIISTAAWCSLPGAYLGAGALAVQGLAH